MTIYAQIRRLPYDEQNEALWQALREETGASYDWILMARYALTPSEARVAAFLKARPIPRSAQQIADNLYGMGEGSVSSAKVILHRMRKKLPPGAIGTVRGKGWRWALD